MSIEKYRNYAHMLLLYPDDLTHVNALEKIKASYDYALIYHDNDKWSLDDEKVNSEHKFGELKKAHYHCVIRFKNAKWNTSISKELGIDLRYIEEVRNLDNAILYLIHFNDEDKYQYNASDVSGTLAVKLKELMNRGQKTEGEKVVELINFISKSDGYISVRDFAEFCALNGYWAEFRRSGSIFLKILEEHNMQYRVNTGEL